MITAVPGLLESIWRYNVGFSASKELKALVPLLASTESLYISGGQNPLLAIDVLGCQFIERGGNDVL